MKRKTIIIVLAMFCALGLSAQSVETIQDDTSALFILVETDPEFPGGYEALYQYLATNIHYNEEARAEGVQGKVFVSFVVEKDGSVNTIRVLRSPDERLSAEAVRVVEAMPKWKPGKTGKKPVRVTFTLPITFSLDDEE